MGIIKATGKVIWLAVRPLSKAEATIGWLDVANIILHIIWSGGGAYLTMIWDWFQPYYLWIFPTILFLVAAFKLQRKTDDYESKSPYIVFQGGEVATATHYKQKQFVPVDQEIDRTEAVGLEVYHMYVFVKNDPQGYRGEERTVRKAVCAIGIYETNNLKEPFVSSWGSWRGTPQVMTRPSHVSFEDLAEFDLPPNGFPHRVDFALKFREDEDMYGYNDEAQRYSKDGRFETLKLPPQAILCSS